MPENAPFAFAIGLGFSGGGFRAAAFNLGVLTYLDSVTVNEQPLLQHVKVLSTVSGGTITGARYAIGIKKGESLRMIYKALYSFMTDVDLVALSLDNLASEKMGGTRIRSLINAAADVYHEHLFQQARFGELLNDEANPIHLRHLSFNATEFCHGIQFRFQCSEKINNPAPGEPERGIIGNANYRLPFSVAKDIRMADILAASSCFPGGFEPINFPSDFVFSPGTSLSELKEDYPVGLMDGGIVDNQGIEPILLADKRMKRNDTSGKAGNALDLVIVSDVASPYMEKYTVSRQQKANWWRKLTPALILGVNTLLLIATGVLLGLSIRGQWLITGMVASSLFTLSLLLFLTGRFLKKLPLSFQVPEAFMAPLGKLLQLKLIAYENLVSNRIASLLKLSNDVFLKHVRRLNYKILYEDAGWENRRIMNAIYELRAGEAAISGKIAKGELPAEMLPSEAVSTVAKKAADMATTLWFEGDAAAREDMMQAVVAAGQLTMCWNLLEYLQKIRKDSTNTTAGHQQLLLSEPLIMEHWKRFKQDPLWMVKQYNNR